MCALERKSIHNRAGRTGLVGQAKMTLLVASSVHCLRVLGSLLNSQS